MIICKTSHNVSLRLVKTIDAAFVTQGRMCKLLVDCSTFNDDNFVIGGSLQLMKSFCNATLLSAFLIASNIECAF